MESSLSPLCCNYMVPWRVQLLSGQSEVAVLGGLLEALHVDSTTSYVWIHHAKLPTFPASSRLSGTLGG